MLKTDKILLILDLDETLIHATKKELSRASDFKVSHYNVYKRPFLDTFLIEIAKHFHLAIWSSASDEYVSEVVKNIIPETLECQFVWGRSKATTRSILLSDEDYYRYQHEPSHYYFVKNLKKVKKIGFNLEKTLIVDDTPQKVKNNYGNAIYAKEYLGEENDNELELLFEYLLTLKDVENVRVIEKRLWRTLSKTQ
jgi:carboxy-terminal domain RNA polymerase II polypeptide A small phosphatase